jgi:hypothetical protein
VVHAVRGNAESVSTASAQIAQGNQDLSGRTKEQASALEETACWRRSKFDPPCRLNFDPGLGAGIG